MGHEHNVHDLDARFTIDPVTRQIKNESKKKLLLAQGDHNSEIYGFRCPRYIESHDMSLCNKVEVHFFNYESQTKKFNSGKYEVKDLKVGEDEDTVEFSWLISGNGTQLEGYTEFLIRFKCVDENNIVTYAWNTLFFSDVNVGRGSTVDELFETEYVDIIAQWKASVMKTFKDDLTAWKTVTAEAVRKEAFEDIATERKRIDFLSNYVTPQMFGAKGDGVTDDTEAFQRAVEQLGNNVPLMVIPYGVYYLTNSIVMNGKTNIKIIGVGQPIIKFASKDDTTSGFYFANYNDIEVSGLSFESVRDKTEYPPSGHGEIGYNSSNILALHLVGGENAVFKNNRFSGMKADYWILGSTNKNILVDGWVSLNASMPAYCSHLDNAEFHRSRIVPATKIGAGNHAFYISSKSKNVKIIDCECMAEDNTFSSLISHYDAHDETNEEIQPIDLLVKNFKGKGARLYVGNRFAKVRFENVEFEQIYGAYLIDSTKAEGEIYSNVECVLSHVNELEIVGCRFITLDAGVVFDGLNSERVLIESSFFDLGTNRLVLARSKAVIKNSDFICGTFIYAGSPESLLDVYVSGCRIKASNYIFSRRNNNEGKFVFANNVIFGNERRFYYSGETSDCTGVTLLNNYMFDMSETFKLGSENEIANIVSLNNYLNGVAI